ncbi:hypothetical protein J1614_006150 [Plenodomus biglobosus]|nr:hypothetical protein J1614_006150 [Plenodomus biglobosus]
MCLQATTPGFTLGDWKGWRRGAEDTALNEEVQWMMRDAARSMVDTMAAVDGKRDSVVFVDPDLGV